MATAPTLFQPSFSYEQSGFNERLDSNKSRRLANRDAMMKIGEEAAAQGQSLTIEDLMSQSQSVMGFGDFLRSTSPSVDMLQGIMKSQNAKAEQVTEERRRSQFANDAVESKSLAEDAKSLFLSGKSSVEVDAELRQRFGEDRVAKLRPNLDRISGMAHHEAMKSGMEMGTSRFQDEDEAKAYVAANPWLPKAEGEGMVLGARKNRSTTERALLASADKQGSGGGWTNSAQDAEQARAVVEAAAPNLSAERKDALIKQYITTASASAKQFESASDYGATQKARAAQAADEPRVQFEALKMDAADKAERERRAALAEKGYLTALEGQDAMAKALDNPKNPMNKEKKIEAAAALRSFYFSDPSALIAAIESGDAKEVAKIKAQAVPIADYFARAKGMSEIISGAHTAPNVSALYSRLAEYGASDKSISALGAEIQNKQKLQAGSAGAANTTPALAAAPPIDDLSKPFLGYQGATGGMNRGSYTSTPEQVTGKPQSAEIIRAAAATEAKLRSGFVENSATYLKEVRSAITSNGRVSATPEMILAEEKKVAMNRAAALVGGMGLTGPAAQATMESLAAEILKAAGSAQAIERTPGFGDMYRQANGLLGDRRNLPEATGRTPPGGLRSQPDPRYAPANF